MRVCTTLSLIQNSYGLLRIAEGAPQIARAIDLQMPMGEMLAGVLGDSAEISDGMA